MFCSLDRLRDVGKCRLWKTILDTSTASTVNWFSFTIGKGNARVLQRYPVSGETIENSFSTLEQIKRNLTLSHLLDLFGDGDNSRQPRELSVCKETQGGYRFFDIRLIQKTHIYWSNVSFNKNENPHALLTVKLSDQTVIFDLHFRDQWLSQVKYLLNVNTAVATSCWLCGSIHVHISFEFEKNLQSRQIFDRHLLPYMPPLHYGYYVRSETDRLYTEERQRISLCYLAFVFSNK